MDDWEGRQYAMEKLLTITEIFFMRERLFIKKQNIALLTDLLLIPNFASNIREI